MDTKSVINVVVSDAPPLQRSVDDIVVLGQRWRRRRTRQLVTVGCATVAIAVLAVLSAPLVLGGASDDARGSGRSVVAAGAAARPPATEPFSFTLRGYSRSGITVDKPRVVSTAYQAAALFGENGELIGYLTVFRPDAFDRNSIVGRPMTTVHGRPAAQWSRLRKSDDDTPDMTDHFLTWQYADRAWATLETFSSSPTVPSDADLRNVADGLALGDAIAAKLPFTLSYVPSGYHLVEVGTHAWTGKDGLAVIDQRNPAGALFARPAPKPAGLTGMWDNNSPIGLPDNFDIAVQPDKPQSRPVDPQCDSETKFCVQWRDGGRVKLYVESGGRLSKAEMFKVLRGIKLASVEDESTWTEVDKAIPVGP